MGIQLDNKISTGHILTVVAMSIGGLGAFFHVQNRVEANAADIARMKSEVALLQGQAHELRLKQAEYASEVKFITSGIQRIETSLDKILNSSTRN